ncbi:hypothetical protein ACFL2V_19465, partial [Pseudomonadota bacterium]
VKALNGDDWVDAGAGRDYVDGAAGDDTIEGKEGSDILFGGASGNDYIYGDSAITTDEAIANNGALRRRFSYCLRIT